MDADRFDTLSRELSRSRSRRGALASLLGGTLGLLGRIETSAKHKRKHKKKHRSPASAPGSPPSQPPPGCSPRCPPDQSCQNGECVCPSGTRYCPDYDLCGECCSSADCCGTSPCPPGSQTCLAGLTCGTSCSDGVMNGNETDIDCGGNMCPGCINGHACHSRNDCQSRLCDGVRCIACQVDSDCGTDGSGDCLCLLDDRGGSKACANASLTGPYASCLACSVGETCRRSLTQYYCYPPCGSA